MTQSVSEVILDGRHMGNHEEYHPYLARKLDFPDYYGNNLDALYDMLTGFIPPSHLVVKYSSAISPRVRMVLTKAAEDRKSLSVAFQ